MSRHEGATEYSELKKLQAVRNIWRMRLAENKPRKRRRNKIRKGFECNFKFELYSKDSSECLHRMIYIEGLQSDLCFINTVLPRVYRMKAERPIGRLLQELR